MVAMPGRDEVLNRFVYHPSTDVTRPYHDRWRELIISVMDHVLAEIPPGRHQDLTLTALQETLLWGNAAIACDSKVR
jgi:hypothetical protein